MRGRRGRLPPTNTASRSLPPIINGTGGDCSAPSWLWYPTQRVGLRFAAVIVDVGAGDVHQPQNCPPRGRRGRLPPTNTASCSMPPTITGRLPPTGSAQTYLQRSRFPLESPRQKRQPHCFRKLSGELCDAKHRLGKSV